MGYKLRSLRYAGLFGTGDINMLNVREHARLRNGSRYVGVWSHFIHFVRLHLYLFDILRRISNNYSY